jgi:catechol 2,3-dioxygenase-like lactoylglutathione lyase family enzyme
MNIGWLRVFAFTCCMFAGASAQQKRPAITGISHMCVYSSDAAATEHFYVRLLGASKGIDVLDGNGTRYYFGPTQFVEVLPLPQDHGLSRMGCVAYNTADAGALLRYLHERKVPDLSELHSGSDRSRWFETKDPEGNRIRFVQPGSAPAIAADANPISTRIIHVGYLTKSRTAEDRFYREILGFKPYWFGAMEPDHVDWVSQQVPDGRDWLEYMMVGEGSTVPLSRVDQKQLGVLNHFSLGVRNMQEAVTKLVAGDRLSPRNDGPKIGKDGKWQFNLYDPDGTRVELMEFQPSTKPCCSAFTEDSPTN